MSDLKERLNRLRRKTSRKKKPAGESPPDTIESDTRNTPETVLTPKQQAILRLKKMIRAVEDRSKHKESPPVPAETHRSAENGLLTPHIPEGDGQHIEDLLPGEYIETEAGTCFRVMTEYPWQFHQGNTSISSLLDADPTLLRWLTKDKRLHQIDFRKTVFFDTETTGLDTGSGVYIFLAGLGYFRDRSFIVEQYFMRDFPEEPAVLAALASVFSRFETIVTFNGKTYDWPLLETRFIINRRKIPLENPPHLDLLHVSRRLYKYRLDNCKLAGVEAGVLDFHRVDDIPGALLPDLYFRYVRSRDARFIQKAFAHNAHDVVSMAAVTARILSILDRCFNAGIDGSIEHFHGTDLYALARLAEENGAGEQAEKLYRLSLSKGLQQPLHREALRRLSLFYKRRADWEKALEIWQMMIRTDPETGVFPFVEIAKYYEHTVHDFDAAEKIVQQILDDAGSRALSFRDIEALRHRLNRLIAKKEGRFYRRSGQDEISA